MCPDFKYFITVMIYCCVLTVYNTLYKSALWLLAAKEAAHCVTVRY